MKFDLGHINKITVVAVQLDAEKTRYHFVTLRKKKDEIDFVKTGEGIQELEALIKQASVKSPFLLHFTGKGVLNRQTKNTENYRHGILLNANLNNFFFTDYLENDQVFSSVIRKDVVEETILAFAALKAQVISISSGPFVASFINSVLKKEKLTVSTSILHFKGDELVEMRKNADKESRPDSVKIGDQIVSNRLILPVSIGAAFFNPSEKIILPDSPEVFDNNTEEARQKNIFVRFGMGMMLFFLALLFSNQLYLGHLHEKIAENDLYLEQYQEQLGEIAQLEDERNRKEKLLQSSGLLNRNFLSYYLMELGNSVPKDITFDNIVIRPLKNEIKQRKKIEFQEHIVLLNGKSRTSNILSKWIEEIEQFEWLEKVDILDYNYVKNEGVFELEMIVL